MVADYVNAKSLFKQSQSKISDYLNKINTLPFLERLSKQHGIPIGVKRNSKGRIVLSDTHKDNTLALLYYPGSAATKNSQRHTRVHPDVAANIAVLYPPRAPRPAAGRVYAITSNLIKVVKIGRWTGSMATLVSRYKTYYGEDLEMATVEVEDCKAAEMFIHDAMADHRISQELFDGCCWDDAVKAMEEEYGPVDYDAVTDADTPIATTDARERNCKTLQLQFAIKREERLVEEQKTLQLQEKSKAALAGQKRTFDQT
ncbi:hypothetical protein WJX74_005957 [Apatococcus lobatus]|uniref:Uncharacterized protein n=1 Tax=Apatococcus lobatus TaxID=904363 RepID=A0AAW1R091_9CHLO